MSLPKAKISESNKQYLSIKQDFKNDFECKSQAAIKPINERYNNKC